MVVFLTIHARYKDVQWGIFKNGTLIESAADESKKVSKHFLVMLDTLLQKHELSLSDFSFIAAHTGPAPLTTLRVSLATINGFSFAQGIPLVGVNGLEALLNEHRQQGAITVALLNAFSEEVYYGIDDSSLKNSSTSKREYRYGRLPARELIAHLEQTYKAPLIMVGNGVKVYEDLIQQQLGSQAHILSHEIASLEAIAQSGLYQWTQGQASSELIPLPLTATSSYQTIKTS